MHTITFPTLLAVALLYFTTIGARAEKVKPPATVYLKKCCPLGQKLDASQSCVVGGTDKWVPSVLLISRGKLYTPIGEAPRFFRIVEATRPTNCSAPLELYTGALVVSSNGSLFVQELSRTFGAADFCVDKDAALVCNPPADEVLQAAPLPPQDVAGVGANSSSDDIPSNMLHTAGGGLAMMAKASGAAVAAVARRPKLRKCCGPRYVYDRNQSNCVSLAADSPHLQRRITNTTTADVIYGFPRCEQTYYTMVEPFRDEQFDAQSGAVRMPTTGRTFTSAEYCVEHTVDDRVYGDVHVFTCAENFGQQEPQWSTGGDKEVSCCATEFVVVCRSA